jgi:hypothetical protein
VVLNDLPIHVRGDDAGQLMSMKIEVSKEGSQDLFFVLTCSRSREQVVLVDESIK